MANRLAAEVERLEAARAAHDPATARRISRRLKGMIDELTAAVPFPKPRPGGPLVDESWMPFTKFARVVGLDPRTIRKQWAHLDEARVRAFFLELGERTQIINPHGFFDMVRERDAGRGGKLNGGKPKRGRKSHGLTVAP